MELVSGQTLRASLEGNRLDLERTIEFLAQVADALDAAHAAGVTHRDLKPENLMIAEGATRRCSTSASPSFAQTSQGPAKAGHHDQGGPEPTATDGGRLLGTLGYMSPEQYRPADRPPYRYLLVWVRPTRPSQESAFLGSSAFADAETDRRARARPASTHVPGVPDGLERIVRMCLAKDPRIDTDPCAKSRATFAKSVARWTTRLSSKSHDVEIVVDTSSLPV